MNKNEKVISLNQNDYKEMQLIEEGETFGEKNKKKAYKKNSLNKSVNEDLLSNKFNSEGLELL